MATLHDARALHQALLYALLYTFAKGCSPAIGRRPEVSFWRRRKNIDRTVRVVTAALRNCRSAPRSTPITIIARARDFNITVASINR
jgi:hypothetical protein